MSYPIAYMPTIDEIRRMNLAALITEKGGNRAFSERLGVSESQLSQWANGAANSATGKPRGMRTDTAQRIEAAGGKPCGWLDQPHDANRGAVTHPAATTTYPPYPGVAHRLTLHEFKVPATTTWEDLMTMNPLPPVFRVAAPDDALAPKITRGTELIMHTGAVPRPNQVVLVRDAAGALHLRRYGQGTGGNWRALAANDAYLTLDAERDGLVLLAALKWIDGAAY